MVHPLIIGAKGFIGRHLYRFFSPTLGTHHSPTSQLALLNLENPHQELPEGPFDYGIIAAGMGNPAACEKEPARSYLCNVEAPLILAQKMLQRGITPVFFSSDYVFDGSAEFYTEHSEAAPLNAYGRQKAELEKRALQECGGACLILRLSKIYGMERGDGTLFDEMISCLLAKQEIRAATDQVFAPLFVGDLIQEISHLLEKGSRGIFCMAGPLAASRYTMAIEVAKKLGCGLEWVRPILLQEISKGISRPTKLVMKSSAGVMTWHEAIDQLVDQYVQHTV